MSYNPSSEHPVILFDGICNLCCNSVQWIIKRDTQAVFRFASLQSEAGKKLMADYPTSSQIQNSFFLIQTGKLYNRSTAAIHVVKQLSFPWRLLYAFIIIPLPIRNAVYNFIAKNRYNWFGKKEICWVPTPELKKLFLDA
ncbi:MAG: thiol-disulfide oxidoreductase DCC family protein [Bacteroidota bacterium]|nr:thiol-disulfide oxidoreductase DCC family protein [Bacteroidota bacterium]